MIPAGTYGILAEFENAEDLVRAAQEVRDHHYRKFESYSPYPIKELEEMLEDEWNPLPLIVLVGGLLGAATAWSMQTYIAIWDFPINVGGRPLYSWPSFIVILFELTVLVASIFSFIGMLRLSGFPRPHHPLFGIPRFKSVTSDGFFLCVEARDPLFNPKRTTELLEELNPLEVWEVEDD